MDMSSVIVPKSDQINADDLIGGDMLITITDVKITGGQEQPVSIYFNGSEKAFRPCKSMSRVLVAAWGADAKAYVGRTLQLYRDPTVKWGGLEVGGIRIRAMSHIDSSMTMALTATKGSRRPFTVKPLKDAPKSSADDPAAKWTAAYIAKIQGTKDEAALLSFILEKEPRLVELQTKRPELAAEIMLALVEAGMSRPEPASPTPAAGDTAEGAPNETDDAAADVSPHEGAGEATTLQSALDEIANAPDEAKVNELFGIHKEAFPDDADELMSKATERLAEISQEGR